MRQIAVTQAASARVRVEDILAFFFPTAHKEIDWTRPPIPLDKELQQVAPDGAASAQAVDKLVRVWQRDGTET